jgi:hypothetical protein
MNSTTFRVELSPKADQLVARLADRPGFGQALAQGLDAENFATVAAIKQKLHGSRGKGSSNRGAAGLSGDQVLHYRTGRLFNSIGNTLAVVSGSGNGVQVKSAVGSGVGSGSEAVRYAAIHEYGGFVNVPSRPTRSTGRYGKKHPQTRAYSFEMPERSYIRSTYRERAKRYSVRASRVVMNFIQG